jgi:hypothetical protein
MWHHHMMQPERMVGHVQLRVRGCCAAGAVCNTAEVSYGQSSCRSFVGRVWCIRGTAVALNIRQGSCRSSLLCTEAARPLVRMSAGCAVLDAAM